MQTVLKGTRKRTRCTKEYRRQSNGVKSSVVQKRACECEGCVLVPKLCALYVMLPSLSNGSDLESWYRFMMPLGDDEFRLFAWISQGKSAIAKRGTCQ